MAGPARDQLPLRRRARRWPTTTSIYKNGAKEIAHLNGCSITFMAKPDHTLDRHLVPHPLVALARRREPRSPARATTFKQLPRRADRVLRGARDLLRAERSTRTSASRPASWAPTTLAWGHDNRTCGFRIVGHGSALRVGDAHPGRATRTRISRSPRCIAAGLHGIEHGLELPPALEGNAYESDAERFPHSLREAIAALEGGTMARGAFGDEVVDHYLNYARTEQGLFDQRRHLLRARAVVRAWLSRVDRDHDLRSSRACAGASGTSPAALDPARDYVRRDRGAGGAPLLVPAERGRGSRRRSTRSTGILFSGGADLDPARVRRRSAHPETTARGRERDRRRARAAHGRARARHARARGLPRLAGAERRARRRPRPAPARGRRATRSTSRRRASSPSTRSTIEGREPPRRAARRARAGQVAPPPGVRRRSATGSSSRRGPTTARSRRSRIRAKRFAVGVLWHPEEGEDAALFERSSRRRAPTAPRRR